VTAAYVGRMLAIKGVGTLVEAQRLLHAEGVALQLLLAGTPDLANPSSFDEATLRDWSTRPGVVWYGHSEDVREVWATAHIAVIASQGGEGVPKTLLEAAAVGRPIVATDVPGNRDIARNNVNAILVPPGDARALADALKMLAADPAKRRAYAASGRRLAAEGFSEEAVSAATVALYRALSAAV
jgi:glycosyltransferase involved in cell wall biosynthesis